MYRMHNKLNPTLMYLVTLACILVSHLLDFGLAANSSSPRVSPRTKNASKAFFVFGDSLVDNGNNNFLITSARADSPPYGIDYPTHRPTGRFSNGKNIPDFIGEHIGVGPLLPYLDPNLSGKKLLNGANFASAGVGILNDTGMHFVDIIRMPYQLAYFEKYKERVHSLIGKQETEKLVNKALVLITIGGNDFVNNYYFVPNSLRSLQYKLPDYVTLLTKEYQNILMKLYKLGARKVLVTATGPLGCAPAILALRSQNGECIEELQKAADLYNQKLSAMTAFMNKKLGSDVFVYVESHNIIKDMTKNSKTLGFEVTNKACCGQGPYNGLGLCTGLSNLCPDRNKYMFWDAYHPSERMNRLIVEEMYSGFKYMKPMNLSTLMAIDSTKI
ncbi:hypothetical protein LXL04_021526 [Taraxacum kok-saghyz]